MNKSPVLQICLSMLILLFAYTAISKLTNLEKFRFSLNESPLIHTGAGIISILLPAIELLIVLLLFLPSTVRAGLKSSLVVLVCFTLYLFYMIVFAPKLPCSCGGVISLLTWKQHIFFNLFFIGVNVFVIYEVNRLYHHKRIAQ